jgi:phage-related minor tail protein
MDLHLQGAAAAATAAFATGKLVQIADEWNSVNARLKQASSSADDFAASQRQLMEISQRTGTAFSDNANLFSRAAASMREYGYSSDEVLKITEAVSTGLKLSGLTLRKRVLLSLNSARLWRRAFFAVKNLTPLTKR